MKSKPKIEKWNNSEVVHLFYESEKNGKPARRYLFRLRNFAVGSSILKGAHLKYLSEYASTYLPKTLSNPYIALSWEFDVLVRGGTSRSGSKAVNERLARQRAEAVIHVLKTTHGIDANYKIYVDVTLTEGWEAMEAAAAAKKGKGLDTGNANRKIVNPEDPDERCVEVTCGNEGVIRF